MKKLIKKSASVGQRSDVRPTAVPEALSRRAFLRNSSLMAGGAALATSLSPTMMKKAQAATASGGKIDPIWHQAAEVPMHCESTNPLQRRSLSPGRAIAIAAVITLGACVVDAESEVILYKDSNFEGWSVTINVDTPNLHEFGWGDTVSSLRVLNEPWTLFEHTNYEGQQVTLPPGDYRWIGHVGFRNDALSSLRRQHAASE